MIALIVALVVIAILALVLYRSVRTVPEACADIIERFGKYHRTLRSGSNVVLPLIDTVRSRVDLREQVVSFPPQPVSTSDNLLVSVDTVVYFRVTDPKAATYSVANYITAIEERITTAMRGLINEMDLERTLSAREDANTTLHASLTEVADEWGIQINRVELKAIDPPASVQESMEKKKQAEREKQAALAAAEAEKQSQILTAEGERQSAVLRARGEAEAAAVKAKGEAQAEAARARGQAEAIGILARAIEEADPDQRLLVYQYLQTLPRIAEGRADKVWVVPGDVAGVLGAVGAQQSGAPSRPREEGESGRAADRDADQSETPKGYGLFDEAV